MSRTILELFLPFRLFKKTANIRWTTTSAQILNLRSVSHMKTIQNGGYSAEKNRLTILYVLQIAIMLI